MKLSTNKGVAFQIDDDDAFAVERYSWYIGNTGYPVTNVGKSRGRHPITLHAFLLGNAPTGLECDHINRDKLDNRRSNLRSVPHIVNMRNRRLNRNSTSGERGVSWYKSRGKWRAMIGQRSGVHQSCIHLGYFTSKDAAVAARLAAEIKLWGGAE